MHPYMTFKKRLLDTSATGKEFPQKTLPKTAEWLKYTFK